MEQPSVFAAIVFDLHPKVKAFLDNLNANRQIDLDSNGYPYVIKSERHGNNIVTSIRRNNKVETFILNPRKKGDPVKSWGLDGFVRKDDTQKAMLDGGNTQERQRRNVANTVIEHIIDEILMRK